MPAEPADENPFVEEKAEEKEQAGEKQEAEEKEEAGEEKAPPADDDPFA